MKRRADPLEWCDKDVFTTGEAAEICRISQQTIIRCFDSGRLRGFRVPGSRFRRIPRAELIRFMKRNAIPTDALESEARRVLVVDDDSAALGAVREAFEADRRLEVRIVSSGYDAGRLTEIFRPHLILLGERLVDVDGVQVCRRIRANPELESTKVLIITVADSAQAQSLAETGGADGYLHKPLDASEVLERIEEVLSI